MEIEKFPKQEIKFKKAPILLEHILFSAGHEQNLPLFT